MKPTLRGSEIRIPHSAFRIVLDASLEVRSALVYASLIVVAVFLPVFFLDGLAGSFFRPLALAYVVAILASLFVALTVTPALSYLLLTGRTRHRPEAPLARLLKALYRPLLRPLVTRPGLCLLALVLAFGLAGVAATRLGQEFLPDFQETDFLMHFVEKPGTSVEAMDRVTTEASKALRQVPGVRNFGSHIGRAEVADEPVGAELHRAVDQHRPRPPTTARPCPPSNRSCMPSPGCTATC